MRRNLMAKSINVLRINEIILSKSLNLSLSSYLYCMIVTLSKVTKLFNQFLQ